MTPFPQPTDKAAEDGYLQLGSVCQLLIVGNYRFAHDYGCMHPGMPPGRIHSRRSRDAPIYTACASAVLHGRPEPVSIAATAKTRLRQFHGDRFQRSIFNLSGWRKEVNPPPSFNLGSGSMGAVSPGVSRFRLRGRSCPAPFTRTIYNGFAIVPIGVSSELCSLG